MTREHSKHMTSGRVSVNIAECNKITQAHFRVILIKYMSSKQILGTEIHLLMRLWYVYFGVRRKERILPCRAFVACRFR